MYATTSLLSTKRRIMLPEEPASNALQTEASTFQTLQSQFLSYFNRASSGSNPLANRTRASSRASSRSADSEDEAPLLDEASLLNEPTFTTGVSAQEERGRGRKRSSSAARGSSLAGRRRGWSSGSKYERVRDGGCWDAEVDEIEEMLIDLEDH